MKSPALKWILAMIWAVSLPCASAQIPGSKTQFNSPPLQNALIDDALRPAVDSKPANETPMLPAEELEFPPWLELDTRPTTGTHGSINTREANGTRWLVFQEFSADLTPFRTFTIEDGDTFKIKATRNFSRDEAKSFSSIFPQFAEYAETIPEKQGNIEIGIVFSASVNYEFRDQDDLRQRAPQLFLALGPAMSSALDQQKRQAESKQRMRQIVNERLQQIRDADEEKNKKK